MSIIFQLFNAMDLKSLTKPELDALKKEVVDALHDPCILIHVKSRADEVYAQLIAPVSENSAVKTPGRLQVPRTEKRDLKSLIGAMNTGQNTHEPRAPKLFSDEELKALDDLEDEELKALNDLEKEKAGKGKNRQILEWAIECELQHSYQVLVAIQTRVQYFFSQLPSNCQGNLPQAPDTGYTHLDDLGRIQNFGM